MSYISCITQAEVSKKISKNRADRLRDQADKLEQIYQKQYMQTDGSVRLMAEKEVLAAELKRTRFEQYATALDIKKFKTARTEAMSHSKGLFKGVYHQMQSGSGLEATDLPPVEDFARLIKGDITKDLYNVADKFRANLRGMARDEAGQYAVVDALYGDTKDQTSTAFAKNIKKVTDNTHKRMRRAGLDVGYLEDFHIPNVQDSRAVRGVSFETWASIIKPNLDRAKILDFDGYPMTDAELDRTMKNIYHNIITDGAWGRKQIAEHAMFIDTPSPAKPIKEGLPSKQAVITPRRTDPRFSNRMEASRFFRFKDAEGWKAVHKAFGRESPFESLNNYLTHASREIAFAEKWGPKYKRTFKYLLDLVAAQTDPKAKKSISQLQGIYDYLRGNMDVTESPALAATFGTVRNLTGSALLGFAGPKSVVLDIPSVAKNASIFNQSIGSMLRQQYGTLFGVGKHSKKELEQFVAALGFGIETAIAQNKNRFFDGNQYALNLSKQLLSLTISTTGLKRHDDLGLIVPAFHSYLKYGDLISKEFNKLPKKEFEILARHGINEASWNILRHGISEAELQGKNFKVLDTTTIYDKLPQEIIDKYGYDKINSAISNFQGLVQEYAHRSIPRPTARTSSAMLSGARQGTISGELLRDIKQFTSFPMSYIVQNLEDMRTLPQFKSKIAKVKLASAMIVSSTALGAAYNIGAGILKGKGIPEMDNTMFWANALIAGGGLPYMSDLALNPYGDPTSNLFSLVGGATGGVAALGLKTIQDITQTALDEKDDKFIRMLQKVGVDATKLTRRLTPVQTFYTQLLSDRLIFDQLQKALDPNWDKNTRRKLTNAEKEGNSYYWEPGDILPSQ